MPIEYTEPPSVSWEGRQEARHECERDSDAANADPNRVLHECGIVWGVWLWTVISLYVDDLMDS